MILPSQHPCISMWGVRVVGFSEPFCYSVLHAKLGLVLLQSMRTCHHLVKKRESEAAAFPCAAPPAITGSLKAFTSY